MTRLTILGCFAERVDGPTACGTLWFRYAGQDVAILWTSDRQDKEVTVELFHGSEFSFDRVIRDHRQVFVDRVVGFIGALA